MSETVSKVDDNRVLLLDEHVILSRVTLNRNIKGYPFVKMMTAGQREELENRVVNYLSRSYRSLETINTADFSKKEWNYYREKGLLPKRKDGDERVKMALIKRKNLAILFSSTDHLRISAEECGYRAEELYNGLATFEDRLEGEFSFLASPRYGYLSPVLDRCGLGMTAEVFLHLPGIGRASNVKDFGKELEQRGYYLKKWPFNSKESFFYYISTKLNFGLNEVELVKRFAEGLQSILDIDMTLVENFKKDNPELEDTIYRSYGTLQYAKQLAKEETVTHFSNLLTGMKLELDTPGVKNRTILKILTEIQDQHIENFSESNKINNNKTARAILVNKLLGTGRK